MKLKKYLEENNLTKQFLFNLEKQKLHTLKDGYCIANAFFWAQTPEGRDFWKNHDTLSSGKVKIKLVKATGLAQKLYPYAINVDGWLYTIEQI